MVLEQHHLFFALDFCLFSIFCSVFISLLKSGRLGGENTINFAMCARVGADMNELLIAINSFRIVL